MRLASLQMVSASSPQAQFYLMLPLLFAMWMAWSDAKTRRIPNYLNLGCLLTGLVYQLAAHGWTGLLAGLSGATLGFALLIPFYLRGGFGAGDVKALAALGAWLGPLQTLFLFIYMALAGILVVAVFLLRRGLLKAKVLHFWAVLVNWLLLRPYLSGSRSSLFRPAAAASPPEEGIPYALSLALGMAILCGRSLAQ